MKFGMNDLTIRCSLLLVPYKCATQQAMIAVLQSGSK